MNKTPKQYEQIAMISTPISFLDSGIFQCRKCGHCCEICKGIKYTRGDKFKVRKYPCEYYNKDSKQCIDYKNRPKVCKMYPFNYQVDIGDGLGLFSFHGICPECRRLAKFFGVDIGEVDKPRK